MRLLLTLTVAVAGLVVFAPAAAAHTEFESSIPVDGESVDAPVDEIVVTFTAAAEPAGDGFQVLTPEGTVLMPMVAVSDDGRQFTLLLGEPLAGGTVGVRWSVRAGDAHPIEGSFSFTTPTTPEPLPSATAEPIPTPTPVVSPTPAEDATPSAATTTPTSSPTAAPTQDTEPIPTHDVTTQETDPVDLDSFLETDDGTSAADAVGFVGRALMVPAALLAIGIPLVGSTVRNGNVESRTDRVVAGAAATLFVGSLIEAVSFLLDGAGELLGDRPGLAIGMRIAAAVAVGVAAVGGAAARHKVTLALFGAALGLASFLFDGHTVTEGHRLLTATVNVAHSGAAAVWIGGVATLVVLGLAKGPGVHKELTTFAVRFSVMAAVALAVAGAAGVALTITILDSFSGLWTTSWGRTLLVKTALVAGAAGLGAYNHFVLVPAVERNDDAGFSRFRTVIRLELALLAAVAITTAVLVAGAAS